MDGLRRSTADRADRQQRRRSVLVVTAYPDERTSTGELRRVVDDLRERPGVTVEVWFLRCMDHQVPWPGGRVVDSLRTWRPARLLSSVGAERLAGLLRGARLRRWIRALDPDVVVFDDGVGDRLVGHTPRRPLRVVRLNPTPPADRWMEPGAESVSADLLLVHPANHDPEPTTRMRMVGTHLGLRPDAVAGGAEQQRDATRDRLGVPAGVPLVVGWGSDGWLDGPDLFVRMLWALGRTVPESHGLWLGMGQDPHELERLRSEARRCGVEARMHFSDDVGVAARVCGDAVFLPDRSPGRDPEEIMEAIVAGAPVVTFPMLSLEDDALIVVPPLDVEAAADALRSQLDHRGADERSRRCTAALWRLDVCVRVEALLAPSNGSM